MNVRCFLCYLGFWDFYLVASRKKIDELIRNHANSQACKQPLLPVYSPEMMKFVKEEALINCSKAGTDWVVCQVWYSTTIVYTIHFFFHWTWNNTYKHQVSNEIVFSTNTFSIVWHFCWCLFSYFLNTM